MAGPKIWMHCCKAVRVESNDPSNENEITLEVQGEADLSLTLFGFPKSVTDKLLLAFGDEDTRIADAKDKEAA